MIEFYLYILLCVFTFKNGVPVKEGVNVVPYVIAIDEQLQSTEAAIFHMHIMLPGYLR